jgi:hypothetical protein
MIKINSRAGIIADYWEKNPQTILDTPAWSIGYGEPGSAFFISHFSPFDNTQDLLSLLNAGEELVEVEIQVYLSDGKKLDSRKLTLEPYEQVDELMAHYFDVGSGSEPATTGTIIVSGSNASLVVTSHIFDLENGRHLGKAYAQVIR